METREQLYRAAITCAHDITEDTVILHIDRRLPGNALSQMADRLDAAYAALSATQEKDQPIDAVEMLTRWLAESDPAEIAEQKRSLAALLSTQAKVEPVAYEITDIERGFDYSEGMHTPWVKVSFPTKDWNSRDAFADAIAAPSPTPSQDAVDAGRWRIRQELLAAGHRIIKQPPGCVIYSGHSCIVLYEGQSEEQAIDAAIASTKSK